MHLTIPKIICSTVVFLSLFYSPCFGQISKGRLHIENPDVLQNRSIDLNGEWEFYWHTFIRAHPTQQFSTYIHAPGYWLDTIYQLTGNNTSTGSGTYRLVISGLYPQTQYAIMIKESPGAASNVYANGVLIAQTGYASVDPLQTIPQKKPFYAEMFSSSNGEIDLCIQVSNDSHRRGGLWDAVTFGTSSHIFKRFNTISGSTFFICGTLLVLFIFNAALFLLNRQRKVSLFYALFVLTLTIRLVTAGFGLLPFVFPHFPYGLQLKLEYMALWASPIAFLEMLRTQNIANNAAHNVIRRIMCGIMILIGISSFILPIRYASRMVPFLQLGTCLSMSYLLYILIYNSIKGHSQSIAFLSSLIFIACGVIAEIVFVFEKGLIPISPLPYALLCFASFQFLYLSRLQSRLYRERLLLTKDLQKLNESYLRFVPKEFLSLLNKKNIAEVALGDHTETEMAIIFSQILIEGTDEAHRSPQAQYDAFSIFLSEITPIVMQHHGFISKFIGRGFIALFPVSPDDALECGKSITQQTNKINHMRKELQLPPIQAGLGIHWGKMILGTIGEASRLDDTVISDTVNTAARLESVSESTKRSIIISQAAAVKISETPSPRFIPLGNISIKGKRLPIELFEYDMTPLATGDTN